MRYRFIFHLNADNTVVKRKIKPVSDRFLKEVRLLKIYTKEDNMPYRKISIVVESPRIEDAWNECLDIEQEAIKKLT